MFGDNFIVVLDLFHAIQRVTKIPKKKTLKKTLKSQVINCKLGGATAVAILTVVFYRQEQAMFFCVAVQPILVEKTSKVQMPVSNEKFGIVFFSPSEDYIYNTSWNNELCDSSTTSASIRGLFVSNECNTDQIQVVNLFLAMKCFDEQMAGIGSEYIPFETRFVAFLPNVLTVINHYELHSQYGSLVNNTTTNGLLSN